MMRIALFLITNLAIMLIFGFLIHFAEISTSSMISLMITAGLLGFGGALISLYMSKSIALYAVNGEIIKDPKNEIEKWLLTIVKNQSKNLDISTPQVAIYDSDDINAFATGASRNSSVVAVSTGLLKNMTNEEAEAVIAHEISHISNGDMVTMTLIQGVINTFVIFASRAIAQFATIFFTSSRDESEEKNGNPFVYFIMTMILELIFGIFASIITMWFSRHREFYADAGSAKLVGCQKMISALQKLKKSFEPQEPNSIITFCINGRNRKSFLELFMSHPPLDKRIQALRLGTYLRK